MRKKFFRSLKVQMPYSFATISLITTSIIGLVLYFIIWNYYTGLEERYLDANVQGFSDNLTRIADTMDIQIDDSLEDYEYVFQGQSQLTAFLIQSRVKVMDNDHEIIADSGSPSESWNITIPNPPSSDDRSGDTSSDENQNSPSSFSLEPSEGQLSGGEKPPPFTFRANPNIFGFQLKEDAVIEYDRRSTVVVETPFYNNNGDILGYIEISESPNYGRSIIINVIRGLLVASLFGITISHAFGFLMSRYLSKPLVDLEKVAIEMKNGNYAIRSTIHDPEELASLSETFNQMAAQIQHNIETLRNFISDAAHEIRTPLTSLHADLNLALSEKSIKNVKPMVKRSLEQIGRLDQLTKDLLDLSRLESKNEIVVTEKVNLSNKLMEICEIHASAAEQADIEFQVQISSDPVYINADAHQFQRAVSNLLNNAVKFSQPGGKVTLKMYTESQSAIILIEDEGIGVPLDERDKLFNRFHRGKNTQNYPGSGLGLAISRIIVEKHNGAIGILPDKKKTIFFIRMPLA